MARKRSLKAFSTITHTPYSGYKRVSMTQKLAIVRDLRFEFITDVLKTSEVALLYSSLGGSHQVLKSLSMHSWLH